MKDIAEYPLLIFSSIVIIVNTQSIMAEKESLWHIIDSHQPDVILVSETWLKGYVHDSEIFPADLGYEIFRIDRSDGYGGVLIAVKRKLVYELVAVEDDCELVAVKINCKYNSLIVAALYITKTRLFKYTENFTTKKNGNFSDKKI